MSSLRLLSMSMQIAFSAMATFGFATTFLNTPVQEFQTYLNESYSSQLSTDAYDLLWNVILNIWLIGFLLGMILSPLLNDQFGRKAGLLTSNVCNLAMAIVQWAGVYFFLPWLLLIGRLISSIACAIAFQSIILFLQEFPPSSKRGEASYTSDVVFSFFCFAGMTLGTNELLGTNLPLLTAMQILLCVISVLVTVRLHESPKFLLLKRNDEIATLASIEFFQSSESAEAKAQFLEELRREGRDDTSSTTSFNDVRIILNDVVMRKTLLLGLAALQIIVPLWTILFNSTDLLLDLKATKFIAQWTSSGMVVCYLIGTIIGSILVDRVGRRILYIPCSAISTICIAAIAAAFYLKPIFHHAEYIAVTAMLLNFLVFGVGIASIAWFVTSELTPQRYRCLMQSMVAVINTVEAAVFTFAVMPLYRAFGAWVFLVLFCLISSVCIVFLYFELPETKGRPISEITEEVRKGVGRNKNVPSNESATAE